MADDVINFSNEDNHHFWVLIMEHPRECSFLLGGIYEGYYCSN